MLPNYIWLIIHRHIPFLAKRWLCCWFIRLWIVVPILKNVCVGDSSTHVDGNHIDEFLISERKLSSLCQCNLASMVPKTFFARRLPRPSMRTCEPIQLSWLLLWLQKLCWWFVVQWRLCLTFSWLHFCEFGFSDDISVEVLIQDRFFCSIWGCVAHSFSEWYMSQAVKCSGQWDIHHILFSWYAVPNESAWRCSDFWPHLFLFENVHKSQASAHMKMLQKWLPSMPGVVQRLANYWSHRSVVLGMDHQWACKHLPHLSKCGNVQHTSCGIDDHPIRTLDDCIQPGSEGRNQFLSDARWFYVFSEILGGVLKASICTKLHHFPAWLFLYKSLLFFEFLQGFWLVHQYVLICMPQQRWVAYIKCLWWLFPVDRICPSAHVVEAHLHEKSCA